jgi:phosphoadenosine phosphosulfate reductase
VTQKGPSSFYDSLENRKECCAIRKVEPLNRALQGVECWITGLRSEHSENRKQLPIIDFDEQRNIQKVNPLANWTLGDVQSEIKRHNIPYNVLHDRGFVSIGCQPCTRAVKEGEDFRAGRWWWEDQSKKECGLHG